MLKTKRFIIIEIILALVIVIYKWLSWADFEFLHSKSTLSYPGQCTSFSCNGRAFVIAEVALCLFVIYLIIFVIYKIVKLIRHAN